MAWEAVWFVGAAAGGWQAMAGDEPLASRSLRPRYIDLVSDSRSFDRRFTVGLWCVDSRLRGNDELGVVLCTLTSILSHQRERRGPGPRLPRGMHLRDRWCAMGGRYSGPVLITLTSILSHQRERKMAVQTGHMGDAFLGPAHEACGSICAH